MGNYSLQAGFESPRIIVLPANYSKWNDIYDKAVECSQTRVEYTEKKQLLQDDWWMLSVIHETVCCPINFRFFHMDASNCLAN